MVKRSNSDVETHLDEFDTIIDPAKLIEDIANTMSNATTGKERKLKVYTKNLMSLKAINNFRLSPNGG